MLKTKNNRGFTPTPDIHQCSRRAHPGSTSEFYPRIRSENSRAHEGGFKFQNKDQVWGFTMVELLTSVGLFMVVVVASSSLFLAVVQGNRKAVAIQNILDEGKFVLEVIGREIRTACAGTSCPTQLSHVSGNESTIQFTNADGLNIQYRQVGTYTGTQSAFTRASNGDIYVGTDNGKFGKYTPSTNTFTDLTSKIFGFWGTYAIELLAYDSTNNTVYLGGGQYGVVTNHFAKYTIGTDTATNLTSTLSGIFSANMAITGMVIDSANGIVYIGQYATGKFAKYTISSNTATNLTSRISSFWQSNNITALVLDATNGVVYLGGGDSASVCRFAKYTISLDTANDLSTTMCAAGSSHLGDMGLDTVNGAVYAVGQNKKFTKYTIAGGTGTDLTSKIAAFSEELYSLTIDTANSMVYIGGGTYGTKFAQYNIATDTATDLQLKVSAIFNGNFIYALAYDSTNAMIYIAGVGGKFAKCTTSNSCDGVNGSATNLSSAFSADWGTEEPKLIQKKTGAGLFQNITSTQVSISSLRFIISGTAAGDMAQPRVTISMSINSNKSRPESQSSINLQTTVSLRMLDI